MNNEDRHNLPPEPEQLAERLLKLDRRNALMKELKESEKKATPFRFWLGSVAAAIFFIFLVGWLIVHQNYSNQQLAEAHFQVYPGTGMLKSNSPDADSSILSRAMNLYEGEKYAEAIPLFRQIPATHPYYYQVQIYWGNSLLAITDSKQAIEVFEGLMNDSSNEFSDQAAWYLGLAYLQAGQEEKARDILVQLANNSQDLYGDHARELLIDMEIFWRKLPGI